MLLKKFSIGCNRENNIFSRICFKIIIKNENMPRVVGLLIHASYELQHVL
jgi:hypothetical protein